jgi:hypothetical protein
MHRCTPRFRLSLVFFLGSACALRRWNTLKVELVGELSSEVSYYSSWKGFSVFSFFRVCKPFRVCSQVWPSISDKIWDALRIVALRQSHGGEFWRLYLALKSMAWTVLSTSRLERADMVIGALGCTTELLYRSHFVVLEHISEARYGHFWHRPSCPKHEPTKISWRLGFIWFVRAHRSLYSVQVTCRKKMFVSSRKFGTCCILGGQGIFQEWNALMKCCFFVVICGCVRQRCSCRVSFRVVSQAGQAEHKHEEGVKVSGQMSFRMKP